MYQLSGDFDGEESGAAVGQMLVQYSIEENRQAGKAIARIAAQLLDSGAAQCFHQVCHLPTCDVLPVPFRVF